MAPATSKPQARRGRKGRIANPDFLASLARLDREGATQEEACDALGVSRPTYYRAMRKIREIKGQAMRDSR